jgi:hypothetical protein
MFGPVEAEHRSFFSFRMCGRELPEHNVRCGNAERRERAAE